MLSRKTALSQSVVLAIGKLLGSKKVVENIKIMFVNSNKFWAWLVTSSADPNSVALTVRGWMVSIVPILMYLLHNPNLSSLPDDVYSIVIGVLAVVSTVATLIGLVRKIILSFSGSSQVPPAPQA